MQRFLLFLVAALFVAGLGCVQRSVTIRTSPSGALVWLNDKEVGRTPVTVPFEWYGDYDVVIRKEGSETLKTHRQLKTPWYQVPPVDFAAELLIPFTVYDDHVWEFGLAPAKPTSESEIIERARQMRSEAGKEGRVAVEPEKQPQGKEESSNGHTD